MRAAIVLGLLGVAMPGGAVAKKPKATPTIVVEKKPGGVEIDWTAGVIRATGAGAADIRAPNAEIARVGATRQARKDAAERAVAAAVELTRAGADAKRRLAEVRVRDAASSYSSDGSVRLTVALPLEAVRLAVAAAGDAPAEALPKAGGPTAILVDATAVKKLTPRLGLTLKVGDARWAGPTVWHPSAVTAEKDPRIGDKPVRAEATSLDDGALVLDLGADEFAAARNSGALVIVFP